LFLPRKNNNKHARRLKIEDFKEQYAPFGCA